MNEWINPKINECMNGSINQLINRYSKNDQVLAPIPRTRENQKIESKEGSAMGAP
jgi:hypothetical protein